MDLHKLTRIQDSSRIAIKDDSDLHSMLTEMQSFVKVDTAIIKRAESVNLNSSQKSELKTLIDGWNTGLYDEDPEILVRGLENLAESAKIQDSSKVEKVIWISSLSGSIGIVLSDDGFEKRAYVMQVSGDDEEADKQDILEYGGKITLEDAEAIVNHLKKK